MKTRIAAVLMVLTCLAVVAGPAFAQPAVSPGGGELFVVKKGGKPQKPSEALRNLQAGLQLQAHLAGIMDNELLSAHIAITKIKDMALQTKKLEYGIGALMAISNESDEAPIRRAALFALSELQVKAGNTVGAMEALARTCLPAPRRERRERAEAEERERHERRERAEERERAEARERGRGRGEKEPMPDEAREICRWLRAHPDVAHRIIRSHFADALAPKPAGPCGGPCGKMKGAAGPKPPMGVPGMHPQMPMHRPGPRGPMGRPGMGHPGPGGMMGGPGGPGGSPGAGGRPQAAPGQLAEQARRCEQLERQMGQMRQQAEQLNRQLAEKAKDLDRRNADLKRWAKEMEQRERRLRSGTRRRREHDDDDDDD